MASGVGNWETQLRKGLTEFGVLVVLHRGEAYGYELLQRLRAIPGMAATEGTLYPLLARLLESGSLRVRSAPSPNGPQRRYYRLTATGRRRLAAMYEHFDRLHASIVAEMAIEPEETA